MKSYIAVPALGLAFAALASCSSTPPEGNQSTPLRSETTVARQVSSAASDTPDNSVTFTMPNEVGKVLQEAQDDIQRVSGDPIFFTSSTDATGQGRHQVLDSNWKVCSQNVPAGQQVDARTEISFAAVKLSESCP